MISAWFEVFCGCSGSCVVQLWLGGNIHRSQNLLRASGMRSVMEMLEINGDPEGLGICFNLFA